MPKLGPKYGTKISQIKTLIENINSNNLASMIKKGSIVKLDDFILKPDELIVENFAKEKLFVSTDGIYTVALNTKLNADLISEGLARDIIHAVQNLSLIHI